MSTALNTPELQSSQDEEKQQLPLPSDDSQFLVDWEEGHDPLNPKNFRTAWKWLIVTIVSNLCIVNICINVRSAHRSFWLFGRSCSTRLVTFCCWNSRWPDDNESTFRGSCHFNPMSRFVDD
ncbi:putative transporter mfs2 [Hyphodiscus hymeniophilus]|uniref:Transporter mfs2 n=1 Tax=Hyphodiscus hymeniophilus TaxID=353542 RepID=A0A9P6SPJ0_9HELO|nr:putative transporter mfs2 [Hyphodiscus hymeniophilus]